MVNHDETVDANFLKKWIFAKETQDNTTPSTAKHRLWFACE
jgi:hypothetical protein